MLDKQWDNIKGFQKCRIQRRLNVSDDKWLIICIGRQLNLFSKIFSLLCISFKLGVVVHQKAVC